MIDKILTDLNIEDKDKEEIIKLVDNKDDVNEILFVIDYYFETKKEVKKENESKA